MSALRLYVVSAGLGRPSTTRMLADRLTEATIDAISERNQEVEIEVIELRDHARAITNRMLAGSGSPDLEAAVASLGRADGLIAVTPVFSASFSGLFKMFFDVIEPGALTGLPVLMGATAGTPRHSLVLEYAMRPLFAYLGAEPLRTAVFAASQDWGDHVGTEFGDRIRRAGSELGGAMLTEQKRRPADAFDELIPFDQLLGEEG